jgi:1-acyl-sn-glycerol-3-phosphate acyltransferase
MQEPLTESISTTPRIPDTNTIFSIIRDMVGEIHPHWKHLLFTPDTHLERDLGLNNSARMKLHTRIEKALNITLDKTASINATTPLDLMRFILKQTKQHHASQKKEKTTTSDNHMDDHINGSFTATEVANESAETLYNYAGKWLYTIYALSVFLILGLATWALMVITPLEKWRQHIARASTRLFFRCTFTSLQVSGRSHLDANRPQMVVANHTSYLDGFIITASLGIPLHFIVKAELSRIPPIRLILQRFGVEFVDRFNARSGANAIWRIAKKSKSGHTLVFFPEGTFTSFAGLQPFRMGAFIAAARTSAPVVPVAIRGARKILRGNNRFLQRGHIDVTILPPIMPDGDSRKDAVKLRDAARREITANCGEPDLVEITTRAEQEIPVNNTRDSRDMYEYPTG